MLRFFFGSTVGGGVGAWLGSSMGIAALGTAVSGLLPIAIVGGVIGGLLSVIVSSD